MKVSFFNSLSTKIFCLVAILVLATVSANSFQMSKYYQNILFDHEKEKTTKSAKDKSIQAEKILDVWVEQLRYFVNTFEFIFNKENSDTKTALFRFLETSESYQSLEIQRVNSDKILEPVASAFKNNEDSHLWNLKFEESIKSEINRINGNFLEKNIDSEEKILINDMEKILKHALMSVTLIFKAGESERVLVTLTIWKTELNKITDVAGSGSFYLIDLKGKPLSTSEGKISKKKSLSDNELISWVLKSRQPNGIKFNYLGLDNQRKIGGFYAIGKYDLYGVAENDIESALSTVEESFKRSMLYGCFFLLIGLFLTYILITQTTKQLRELSDVTLQIAKGNFNVNIPVRSRDEVGVLSATVKHMTVRIQGLMHEQLKHAETQKELETANMVQNTFFPKESLSTEHFNVHGFYKPASSCGGDLWGYYKISEEKYSFFIADAMGHGVPAALITAMAFATYKSIEEIYKSRADLFENPSEVLNVLNSVISQALNGKMHMTFFLCTLDLSTGKLVYANSGHNFPVILPVDIEDERIKIRGKSKKSLPLISLKGNGTPLGLHTDSSFRTKTQILKPGDKLFCFTDGLIECQNPNGDQMGRKALLEHLALYRESSGDSLNKEITELAFKFFEGNPINDDVTTMTIEFRSLSEKSLGIENAATDFDDSIETTNKISAEYTNSPAIMPRRFEKPRVAELNSIDSPPESIPKGLEDSVSLDRIKDLQKFVLPSESEHGLPPPPPLTIKKDTPPRNLEEPNPISSEPVNEDLMEEESKEAQPHEENSREIPLEEQIYTEMEYDLEYTDPIKKKANS